jgi:uncharacterized protein DUF4345
MKSMRRVLQVLLGIIAVIVLTRFALPGVILGGAWVSEDVTPLLDSEVRFLSALALAPAAILLWIIPRVERHLPLVRIIAIVTFLGGLARVLSVVQLGVPPSRAMIAAGVELFFSLAILLAQRFVHESDSSS